MRLAAIVALAVWLGAALLLVTTVAPAAFDVLPSRALAGALVGRVLPVIFVAGLIASLPALYLSISKKSARTVPLSVMIVCCLVAQFVVAPRIAAVRVEIGESVDALPADDPRRVRFGKLHGESVAYLGAAMLSAAIEMTLLLAVRRRPQE